MEENKKIRKDLNVPANTRPTALEQLIGEFHETNQSLRAAVERDDWDAIVEADRMTTLLFEQILGSAPEKASDQLHLARFLLDSLQVEETATLERIKLKILELVGWGK